MFNNQRYATKGIIAEIPAYLQNMLWYLIETMEAEKKDYLQVFELKSSVSEGKSMQTIIHRQEQPEYSKEITFAADNPVNQKVFCIDDKSHTTMLLSSEY